MATILLAAAGAFAGAGFGGTVLGLSGAVIGRAVGATLGRAIDQRLFGAGSEAVETGRLERLRLMTSGLGGALPMVWGRVRVGGAGDLGLGFHGTCRAVGRRRQGRAQPDGDQLQL